MTQYSPSLFLPHCSLPVFSPSMLAQPSSLVSASSTLQPQDLGSRGRRGAARTKPHWEGQWGLLSCWFCTAPHLSVLLQVMLVVGHPPMGAVVPRLPQPAQSRPQVMAPSAALWSSPPPLPHGCSTHTPHTTAEPRRASVSHHASTWLPATAPQILSLRSTGNTAKGSAFLPCVLA